MVAAKNAVKEVVHEDNFKDMVSSLLPPMTLPSVSRICSFYPSDEQNDIRTEITSALASASINLAEWNLVPALPPVIDRSPIDDGERRIDLKYTIGSLPKLKVTEDYSKSAEIYYNYSHEALEEMQDMMKLTSIKTGLPSIALNADHLPTPFANDFFLNDPLRTVASSGDLIADRTSKFLKSLPPDTNLWVLWGDAGKLILKCAEYVRHDVAITFIGTIDYPLTFYDRYRGYISDELSRDRYVRRDYDCTMAQLIAGNDFSQVAVLANYVSIKIPNPLMLLQIVVDRDKRILPGMSNKTIAYVPLSMNNETVVDYFDMFVFKDQKHRRNTRLYNPLLDVSYNFHHHKVWADKVANFPGILVRELLRVERNDSSYTGNLKIMVKGMKTENLTYDPVLCDPISVSYLSLDSTQLMFFDADQLGYVDYRGTLPGTTRIVDSAMLVAMIGGVWHLVDCDIGKRFVSRFEIISMSSVPSVVPAIGGKFAIAWQSRDIYGVIKVKYSDPDVYHEGGITVSRMKYRGLAVSGGTIIYDGFSQFTYSPSQMYNHIKTDSKLSWRVRFARNTDSMTGGFYFQNHADVMFGEEFVLAHLNLLDVPSEVIDGLRPLCADFVSGFEII